MRSSVRSFNVALALQSLLLVSLACRSNALATTPSQAATTSSTTTSTISSAFAACTARPSGQMGPVTDPNGPFFHQVALATTDDEGRTIGQPMQVLDHASVPDGTRMPDGGIGIYYVNGADGGIWLARVSGNSATEVGPISIDGVSRPQGAVDPDATLLPNGRVRLVYLSGLAAPGSAQPRAICVAESSDGMQFQGVATAVDLASSSTDTDPSVTQLTDGSWLMAISRGQQTLVARSGDGLRFTTGETLSFGGVPEVTTLADGRVRLYVCAAGIESYISGDSGRTWQREGTVVRSGTLGHNIVCDPSRVTGTNLFVFKTGG